MTRPCRGPDYDTRPPKIAPPPLSCDTQAHVFGPAARFPYAEGRGYTPPDCPVEAWVRMLDVLGIARGVIVHGSAHGADNRVTLDAIASAPERFRGVAVIRPDATDGEIKLRQALALAPGVAQLHANLIDLLAARGRLVEAGELLGHKVAAGLATAEDRFMLAGLLAGANRLEESIEHYASAVAQAPEVFAVRFNFGGVLRRLGRYDEAIAQLRQAERLAPADPDTQVELGLAHRGRGERERALVCLRRAIELAPERPESRMHLPELIREIEAGE